MHGEAPLTLTKRGEVGPTRASTVGRVRPVTPSCSFGSWPSRLGSTQRGQADPEARDVVMALCRALMTETPARLAESWEQYYARTRRGLPRRSRRPPLVARWLPSERVRAISRRRPGPREWA